jgi:hypothetical protein
MGKTLVGGYQSLKKTTRGRKQMNKILAAIMDTTHGLIFGLRVRNDMEITTANVAHHSALT